MDDILFDIPTDITATETHSSGSSEIKMHGLRTAYVNKERKYDDTLKQWNTMDNSGVIETLSMTLRIFYPLDETADVFEYPEGTVVVVLSSFSQGSEKKVQLATLYTENSGARWEALKQTPSSDVDFLMPISWNERRVQEMESNRVYTRIMKMLPRTILQNGMFYFFNATILFLYHKHRISIRAQDSIYSQIVLKAESMLKEAETKVGIPGFEYVRLNGLPALKEVYFMLLCYFLWVAESMDSPLDPTSVPDLMDLRPF